MSVEYLPIESIHFGVVPTYIESAEVIWVQSRFPAPTTLQVDEQVILVDCNDESVGKFIVDDIIGTRIVLIPNDGNIKRMIKPSDLCKMINSPRKRSIGRRGLNMRIHPLPGDCEVKNRIRDWVYGSGLSATKLAFIPK